MVYLPALIRLISALAIFVVAERVHAQSAESASATSGGESITEQELAGHVTFLASDTLQGREAGTDGGYAAAVYIVEQLKKSQLKPLAGNGDYYQYFYPNYRNILAVVPGADESLRGEFVLVGAHYDHVGFGNQRNSRGPIGVVHNGADDNASGTAALLEVAEALTAADPPPKRSVLIAFWDGEELGLLGSRHFVSTPPVEMSRISITLNCDMVGRLRDSGLEMYGWRTGTGLRRLLASGNQSHLKLSFASEYKPDSDHWPFFERGIPSVMLHTGKHDEYHRPSDDIDTLNIPGLQQSSQYLYRLVLAAARADKLPGFREKSRQEPAPLEAVFKKGDEFAKQPSRLGVSYELISKRDGPASGEKEPETAAESPAVPDSRSASIPGETPLPVAVRVSEIHAGSPAAQAGLQVGDEILRFGSRSVSEAPDFRTLVLAAASPVEIVLRRGGKEQTVSIELRGQRTVFGFSWWVDDADPGTILVSGVLPGSAAELAGLKQGHRILNVFGKSPSDGASFRKLLLDHEERDVPIEVEFEGNFSQLTLRRLD